MDEALIGSVLASTLRVTTPLLLCALAGLLSERAGVIDIGLEGKMLFAAFAAAAAAAATHSTGLGLMAALAVAVALSLMHGFACVTHRGDQVVTGVALNMVAAGLTVVLGIAWFAQGGQTPPIQPDVRLTGLSSSWAEPTAGNWFEAVIGHGLLSHNALVYLAFALVLLVWFFLERTRPGLRLRAVGENPAMVDAAGVSVPRLRYAALMLNGLLCGLAGAYLTLAQNASFSPNMTAGRGFIALAADVMGFGYAWGTLAAALLLGATEAVTLSVQGFGVPSELLQAIPYLVPVLAMVIHAQRRKRHEDD